MNPRLPDLRAIDEAHEELAVRQATAFATAAHTPGGDLFFAISHTNRMTLEELLEEFGGVE